MQRSESYNTKQKDLILDIIKKQKQEFNVKDIYKELDKKIGLTTIYRYVDKLVNDGILNKTVGEDNTIYYQYLATCECHNHFFLKCTNCGNLTHVDCDCIEELNSHIRNTHKFIPNTEHIILNGICNKCNKEK